MDKRHQSPREFLRARRPEEFSDSTPSDTPALDRSQLEYHLSTLTNRSQETEFETFARHLAQREVCPNLIPQTGPTGGGDGKVDSETYPVADDLCLFWHSGVGRQAASERWGFAFSAKKDWLSKVRSDIEKIAGTKRGYKKAFFVTNQFVPSKKRLEEQDRLSSEHGLDVVILDLSWILDHVFEGKHENIAIEDLKIKATVHVKTNKGPGDLQREHSLKEVEARIQASTTDGHLGINQVADCLESAILARGLDRPRTELDGLFERAERVAAQYGTSHQRLLCAYERARTSFWWHEDYHAFSRHYAQVETETQNTTSVYDLQLQTNLWLLLYPLSVDGRLDHLEAKAEERTASLKDVLDRLSTDVERPSNALQARTLRLTITLFTTAPEEANELFRELKEVVRQCEGLIGYPLEPLAEEIGELGTLFSDSAGYGELFETVVEIISQRKGEVAAARMLVRCGVQQLHCDKPYEAIRLLGRALIRLYKHESRHDLIRALYNISDAYKRVGLLWAARGALLIAASLATIDFHERSEVTKTQVACYKRLKWLELQLGRVVQSLQWHTIDRVVSAQLKLTPAVQEEIERDNTEFDALLGMLLLRSDVTQLHRMSQLPDPLAESELAFASIALLFAMGNENELIDCILPDGAADWDEVFSSWLDHPFCSELPPKPLLDDGASIQLVSHILGCEFLLKCPNRSPFLETGESVLAALESLMATGMADESVALDSRILIKMGESTNADTILEFTIDEDDGPIRFDLKCGIFDPNMMSHEAQDEVKEEIKGLLANIVPRAFLLGDNPMESFSRLLQDDLAFERSLNFTSSFVVLGNVLGHSRCVDISTLCSDAERYEVKRSKPWNPTIRTASAPSENQPELLTLAVGPPPPGLFSRDRLRHTDIVQQSLIRDVLWDRAGWQGVAFFTHPDPKAPLVLALHFKNRTAAERIFENWIDEVGSRDEHECLRVSIVRKTNRCNPNEYRVTIGSNPSAYLPNSQHKQTLFKVRINTMEPASDVNLARFLERYNRTGEYMLGCAFTDLPSSTLGIAWDKLIAKKVLHLRDAWEIGLNDFDVVAIQPNDNPIIPEGVTEIPIIDVLKKKSKRNGAD